MTRLVVARNYEEWGEISYLAWSGKTFIEINKSIREMRKRNCSALESVKG